MKIKFPNTKEGIKKFLEIKKKIMLDKQVNLCYNVGTNESEVIIYGKNSKGTERGNQGAFP